MLFLTDKDIKSLARELKDYEIDNVVIVERFETHFTVEARFKRNSMSQQLFVRKKDRKVVSSHVGYNEVDEFGNLVNAHCQKVSVTEKQAGRILTHPTIRLRLIYV